MTYHNNIYVGTYGSGIFTSGNNGKTWKSSGSTLTYPYIYSFAVLDSIIFAASWGGGVFISLDYGNTWKQSNNGLTNLNVRTLAVKGTRLYAGTWGDGVYVSDDYGASWTNSSNGLNKLSIYTIVADEPNVYLGNDEGVYSSANNGFHWDLKSTGLTNTYVRALVVIHLNLIVGTAGEGIFVSMNSGALWTPSDTGLTDGFIYCLAVNGSKLFAGAPNGEIWSRPISEIITSVEERTKNIVVDNYSLYQNYPNPFNPNTTINYQLPKESLVTLKVFDVVGREVETLVSQNQTAGSYSVSFNSSGRLSSGVYFYQLKAGNFSQVKKMILLK
jgi:ligand-binding sensor domain-containing protein